MRLWVRQVRHGVRPGLLDAAHDRDGVEHAGRPVNSAGERRSTQARRARKVDQQDVSVLVWAG